MPVRDKAVEHILRTVVGHESIPAVPKKLLQLVADALYVGTMDNVDWRRVMLDANQRHISLHGGEYLTSRLDDELAEGVVCEECVHEAMVATEWGGMSGDLWDKRPRSLRNRLLLVTHLGGNQVRTLVRQLASDFRRPDVAPEGFREEDGHLQFCEEVGRFGNEVMLCDPACPHYDGWIERLIA